MTLRDTEMTIPIGQSAQEQHEARHLGAWMPDTAVHFVPTEEQSTNTVMQPFPEADYVEVESADGDFNG